MRNKLFASAKGMIKLSWCIAAVLFLFVAAAANGTLSASTTPQIAAGHYHTLALKSDGTIWAWGLNEHGELGDGTDTMRTTPVQVKNSDGSYMSDVVDISGGSGYSVALKSDGTVWSWGYNGYGALGDGTYTNRNTPAQVKNSDGSYLSGVSAIAAGSFHCLALKSDGTVWAWGYNNRYQLGNSTSSSNNETFPVQVKNSDGSYLSGVSAIAAGSYYSFATSVRL